MTNTPQPTLSHSPAEKSEQLSVTPPATPEPKDIPEKILSERLKVWVTGHELIKRYRIHPPVKIIGFFIAKKLCPFDAKNSSPVLPPMAAACSLDEIRADIAALANKIKRLKSEGKSQSENEFTKLKNDLTRLKNRRDDECIKEWENFASHWQNHEHSLRECGKLNDELNTEAIERLERAVYWIDKAAFRDEPDTEFAESFERRTDDEIDEEIDCLEKSKRGSTADGIMYATQRIKECEQEKANNQAWRKYHDTPQTLQAVDTRLHLQTASSAEPVTEIQGQKAGQKNSRKDFPLEHAKLSAEQTNQRLIENGKPALKRLELAKVLRNDAAKKRTELINKGTNADAAKKATALADYPTWKIDKALTGVSKRGRPSKNK